VDRCALFVDAGYVLADGAMAVHGTRRRESVSWDYPGLVQLLASFAMERSGLPVLRCYWYDGAVDGRRNEEQDALADLPGVKLRLAKVRPGRRAGVEGEIHRDLTALARNKAVSDVMVVSAEEDLAPVIAEVQDMGLRVSLLHIAVDGNGSVARSLRQECDDVVEVGSGHLRPYVELISGAEPPRADEREPRVALRAAANGVLAANGGPAANGVNRTGRAVPASAPAYPQHDIQMAAPRSQPDDFGAGRDAAGPVEADVVRDLPARPEPAPPQPARPEPLPAYREPAAVQAQVVPPPQQVPVVPGYAPVPVDFAYPADPAVDLGGAQELPVVPDFAVPLTDAGQRQDFPVRAELPVPQEPAGRPEFVARQELYAAPVMLPPPVEQQIAEPAQVRQLPTRGAQPSHALVGQHASGQGALGALGRRQPPAPPQPAPVLGGPVPGQPIDGQPSGPQPAVTLLPGGQQVAGYMPANGTYAATGPRPVPPPLPAGPAMQAGPAGPAGPAGLAVPGVPPAPLAPLSPGARPNPAGPADQIALQQDIGGSLAVAGPGPETSGPIGPLGPIAHSGGQAGVSLAEAVQSAHDEGQEFGDSVARDAPALWLEAVLARKPRMPSDLEARLLQGSALPIDYLLHDEVRHALRRGFWDAMERARR
jgi:hypothetical protein